jgi:hypothetical protein
VTNTWETLLHVTMSYITHQGCSASSPVEGGNGVVIQELGQRADRLRFVMQQDTLARFEQSVFLSLLYTAD